ncbi:hypothetical protein C8R46DRAFT_532869 [Mycena filopes]|nr:hypothetical protein C8R46DRAFT_532869 [Mycena filopes]
MRTRVSRREMRQHSHCRTRTPARRGRRTPCCRASAAGRRGGSWRARGWARAAVAGRSSSASASAALGGDAPARTSGSGCDFGVSVVGAQKRNMAGVVGRIAAGVEGKMPVLGVRCWDAWRCSGWADAPCLQSWHGIDSTAGLPPLSLVASASRGGLRCTHCIGIPVLHLAKGLRRPSYIYPTLCHECRPIGLPSASLVERRLSAARRQVLIEVRVIPFTSM